MVFPHDLPSMKGSALFVPSYLPTKRLLLRVKSEGRRAGEAEPSYTPIALLAQDKKAFIFFFGRTRFTCSRPLLLPAEAAHLEL